MLILKRTQRTENTDGWEWATENPTLMGHAAGNAVCTFDPAQGTLTVHVVEADVGRTDPREAAFGWIKQLVEQLYPLDKDLYVTAFVFGIGAATYEFFIQDGKVEEL